MIHGKDIQIQILCGEGIGYIVLSKAITLLI